VGASLGEFGAELAVIDEPDGPDTFLFHGHEFTLPQKVSSLPALRFAYNAQRVVAAEEQAHAKLQRARSEDAKDSAVRGMAEVQLMANAGLYQYLRDMLAEPAEWDRFEQVAAQHGADDDELLAVATKIMAAVAARPTRRSSGSPPGPSPTGDGSTDASEPPAPGPPYTGPVAVAGTTEPADPDEPPTGPSPLELARAEIRAQSEPVTKATRRKRAAASGR